MSTHDSTAYHDVPAGTPVPDEQAWTVYPEEGPDDVVNDLNERVADLDWNGSFELRFGCTRVRLVSAYCSEWNGEASLEKTVSVCGSWGK